MRQFVSKLVAEKLSPASISNITQVVKSIVASAVDQNGNQLYPRTWNPDFLDMPPIDKKAQKAPILASADVSRVVSQAPAVYTPFFVLLAATGARLGEILAVKRGPCEGSYWDPQEAKLVIRGTLYKGLEQSPKTSAGYREIDLHPDVNAYLISTIGTRPIGQLVFAEPNGSPWRLGSLYEAAEKLKVPGFHSFRRFRLTHLENAGIPRGLALFWSGHSGKDIHDSYIRLDKDIKARKEWASQVGLGFELPS